MIPARKDAAKEGCWKVEDLFADEKEWQAAFDKLQKDAIGECALKGKLAKCSDNLLAVLKEYDSMDERLEKLYVYAYMRLYEDMADAAHQEMAGKIQTLANKIAQRYAFLEPEVLTIDEKRLGEWMAGGLAPYAHFLGDMLEQKPHTLDQEREELLAAAASIRTAASDIFSQFNNADIAFGTIIGEDGSEQELTTGRYAGFLESRDRSVRKAAFTKLYAQYKAHINTLAAMYMANVRQAKFYADARKFSTSMEMYLSGNFIPTDVYTQLIETVEEHLPLMHRYVALRKKLLGVDELHMYDMYVPMIAGYERKYNYDEATGIVIKGLAPLGEQYTALLQKGFAEGWVDVYENRGKRSGAFSWGAYGTHPYVCLNFNGTLNDVFTIAHEMGHALHTYHSNAAQPHIYAGYRIFVAEVASTCNEALLIRYLLDNCEDIVQRRYLLNHFLEQFKGTLFRQTMFAEFEQTTHALAAEGKVLSAQLLCGLYRDLNEKYYGSAVVTDEEIAYEWSRIPHFYTPFYVYQYATGFSAAVAISARLLAGDEKVREGYFRFLSGGSSLHPIELLKLCGIDMSKKEPVKEALAVFESLLDELDAED